MSRINKRKIAAVALIVAVIVVAVAAYEFYEANLVSRYAKMGYTKIVLTLPNQPYSIIFGAAHYNITLQPIGYYTGPTYGETESVGFQVSTDNNSTQIIPTQGDKYSFSGLQIVAGSVNIKQLTLTLYVKSATSKSKPIISYPKINIAINFSSNTVSRIWNGSGYDTPKSGYTYVIVNISITNNGYESFDTNATYFVAIANGVSYNYDPETSLIYWSAGTVDNTGNYFGSLVFQIPAGATIHSMSYNGTTSAFQKYNIVWNGQA